MLVNEDPGQAAAFRRRFLPGVAVLGALLLAPIPARAAGEGRRPDPLYRRDSHTHIVEEAPQGEGLPEELRLRLGRHPFPADIQELDRAATDAGRWTAGEISRLKGTWIYYRAGFHDGLHRALRVRPDTGADFSEGLRLGARDPGALRSGEIAGSAAADEIARSAAAEHVEAQFMDLSRQPAFRPLPGVPLHAPVPAEIVPPPLEDVLAELGSDHVPGLSHRFERAFDGWWMDPLSLSRARGYASIIEERWADPEEAFEFWRSGRRRSASYQALDHPRDKQRFREVFMAAYSARLAMHLEEDLVSSYFMGRRDGWRYGAVAVAEWRYRLGYAEGFNQAAATAAAASYAALFPEAYRRHYEDLYRTWSSMAHPEIVSFRIRDGSEDGIFQPGETVLAMVEVANYGGAPGSWRGVIDSAVFEGPVRVELDLPPRRISVIREPAVATVRADVPRGQRAEVIVEGEDLSRRLPILVSYPLQFTGRARLTHIDVLQGSAAAEVEVVNRSRRVVDGDVILAGGPPAAFVAGGTPEQRVESLAPGEIRRVGFQISRVEPLDALSGNVSVHLQVKSATTLHDELTYTLPAVALDLDSRELERFLVALAMNESPPGHHVRRALDLALQRIARDWQAAAQGSGNPYKHDYKKRDGTTALGELVRTYRREQDRIRSPEVFTRLGGEIEEMAGELPGLHPFLRKYLRRLARELG